MYKELLLFYSFIALFISQITLLQSEYYSLVTTFQTKEHRNKIYEVLKSKGYLIDKSRYRKYDFRIGNYNDLNQAKTRLEKVKNKEEILSKIIKVENEVIRLKNGSKIVKMRNSLWLVNRGKNKKNTELSDNEVHNINISQNEKQIIFFSDYKIIKVDLKTYEKTVLVEKIDSYSKQLSYSIAKWSNDGKYIAFLDCSAFEEITSLWLIGVNGKNLRCLIKSGIDTKNQFDVKSFQWNKNSDLIYFIEGYSGGTVTMGGDLYSINLTTGEKKNIIKADSTKGEEILSSFTIDDKYIYYKIVHFDEMYNEFSLTEHKIIIPR